MRTFGRRWFKDGSLMAEYADSLGSAVSRRGTVSALSAARVKAELASKSKSDFIANMSHELRTPLNAIIGFSDMLRTLKIADVERTVEYATYINQAAEHLLALINSILDVSKIQAGRLEIARSNVDCAQLVEQCLLIIKPRAEEKRIRLDCEIEEGFPHIKADALRLKQIFINLLSNAVKFTEPEGRVTLHATVIDEGWVQVDIADTGAGMTVKEIDVALEAFGQVQGGFAKANEGTGLGLPISVALVRMHGGHFDITSSKGRGTLVRIRLPVDEQIVSPPHTGKSHNPTVSRVETVSA